VSVTTNAVGRAAVTQLNPLVSGALQIQVQATYQGQTATAVIQQTNFANAAQAAQAGRAAAQGQAASGSSGMSGAAKAGLIGGAAAAAAGVALSRAGGGDDGPETGSPENRPPTLGGVNALPEIALQASTAVTFSVMGGSDPDNDPLTYAWDFGDGATSAASSPVHVYQAAGVWTAAVTIADGKARTVGQTTVTVRSLTDRWRMSPTANTGPVPTELLQLTQQGRAVSGTYTISEGPDAGVTSPVVGTISESSPAVTLTVTRPGLTFTFTGDPSRNQQAVDGVRNGGEFTNAGTGMVRQ
jgi:hypothetical protein